MAQWGQYWQNGYYPPQPYANVQFPGAPSQWGPDTTGSHTTLLRIDISKRPVTEITAQAYYTHRHLPATWSNAGHIRLISRHFPWSIELIIKQGPVTCEVVWEGLYTALQEPIADSEWGMICADKKQREIIEKAAKKRIGNDADKRPKRIDWLGETVLFRGLEKNEDFEKARRIPGGKPCAETWLVKLAG